MPEINRGEWAGVAGFVFYLAELFGGKAKLAFIPGGVLTIIAFVLFGYSIFFQGGEIRKLKVKVPEYWDADLLATSHEARKSFRHVLDTIVKLEDPELVDGVLDALSKKHQNLWF